MYLPGAVKVIFHSNIRFIYLFRLPRITREKFKNFLHPRAYYMNNSMALLRDIAFASILLLLLLLLSPLLYTCTNVYRRSNSVNEYCLRELNAISCLCSEHFGIQY